MLQYLIWGVCVMIVALGYIAKQLTVLVTPVEERIKSTGTAVFVIMLLIGGLIFVLSFLQGQELQNLLGR